MTESDKAGEEIVARLKLDIRALGLLYDSDSDLRAVVDRAFLESQDRYVVRFLGLLQPKRPTREGGNLPVALAEMVLASFLTLLGLAAFLPAMAGLTSPQQWIGYLSTTLAPASGPLEAGAPVLDFAFAALLLLGAFYSLRRAAGNLKRAGLIVESGRG